MIQPLPLALASALLFAAASASAAEAWWNKNWSHRQPIAFDPAAAALAGDAGEATLLVRLHDGNFSFAAAAPDGGDLRFVAPDGKTLLAHHVEKFDSLLNEAFVWVKLPATAQAATFHLYYGGDGSAPVPPASSAYGESDVLVYHFGEALPQDATSHGHHATTPGILSEGSLIGSGLRLSGGEPVTIPAAEGLRWNQGGDLTLSLWVKPAALQSQAVVWSRGEAGAALRLVIDQGVPALEAGGQRSAPGAPLAAGAWAHLAVVSTAGELRLLVNGSPYATLAAVLPALEGPLALGGAEGREGFIGEVDELRVSSAAWDEAAVKLAATNQGASDAAARLVQVGAVEGGSAGGHSEALEHVMLFGDIARNMMFDGWIAIGVCVLMILVGWTVAVQKFLYLNSIQKGSEAFLAQWKRLSSDLTAIDHADDRSVRSLGGNGDPETQQLVERSPLYEIYHLGSEEIKHRLARDHDRTRGLSGRSIQAIRAALDAGLVRATHKLTNGLVYLTISIAGGPYVGLLGTVVGVMITFAIIAKSGEVDVNSIAPGIASALLATVAGLVVAIPALFIYSYLNGRIKNATAEMHVFIDEFVAKMAEFYPPAGEASPYAPIPAIAETPGLRVESDEYPLNQA